MEGFLCAKVNVGEVNKTDVLEIFNVWMQKCVNIVDAIGKLYAKDKDWLVAPLCCFCSNEL